MTFNRSRATVLQLLAGLTSPCSRDFFASPRGLTVLYVLKTQRITFACSEEATLCMFSRRDIFLHVLRTWHFACSQDVTRCMFSRHDIFAWYKEMTFVGSQDVSIYMLSRHDTCMVHVVKRLEGRMGPFSLALCFGTLAQQMARLLLVECSAPYGTWYPLLGHVRALGVPSGRLR